MKGLRGLGTALAVLLAVAGGASTGPAGSGGGQPPRPAPFPVMRHLLAAFLSPELTMIRHYQYAGRPVSETVLRVWNADGTQREVFRGDELDMRVLGAEGVLIVRDRVRKVWRVESWLTGAKFAVPFDTLPEDNPWLAATKDARTVGFENWGDGRQTVLTFYANGKQAARYEVPPTAWAHLQMSDDGYSAYLAGPEDPGSSTPAPLTLFDPSGRVVWHIDLPGGEGRLGPGGFWPAPGGQGVLLADYSSQRTYQLLDAKGKPRPAIHFAEATEFRAWVGSTTAALFESAREAAAPGHMLTLVDCAAGRTVWQVSQPDVDLSALLVVDDPTKLLGTRVILQAAERSWMAGKQKQYYSPPFGLVQLRFLRADNGNLINSYETASSSVDNWPARFDRRGADVWLVDYASAKKIDVARAIREVTPAQPAAGP
jgi:hypothetical protein